MKFRDLNLLFLIASMAILLMSCASKLDYHRKEPWFKAKHLHETTIVLLPAFVYGENKKGTDVDMLLETLSRRHFKDSTVVGASTARKILEKEGKDSTLETFFWEFTTSEFLDATLFREFSAEWEEQWDVSYALITEVKRIEPYQLSRMKPSAPQEENKTKIEQRVSGVKATLRLSVIRISDSALAWLGETSTKKENTRSVEKVEKEKKGLGEQIIDSIIEGFVSGTFSDTDEPAYPPYPTIDAVIAKTFNCILNKLSKSSSPRWKRYFSDTLTCM